MPACVCVCVCVCVCLKDINIPTLQLIISYKLTFKKFMRGLKPFPLKSVDPLPGNMYVCSVIPNLINMVSLKTDGHSYFFLVPYILNYDGNVYFHLIYVSEKIY